MLLEPGECYPDSVLVSNVLGNTVFAWFCGQAAIWDSVAGDSDLGAGGSHLGVRLLHRVMVKLCWSVPSRS